MMKQEPISSKTDNPLAAHCHSFAAVVRDLRPVVRHLHDPKENTFAAFENLSDM